MNTMHLVAAFLGLQMVACGDGGGQWLAPGHDISGNWLGCVDEGCSRHEAAGYHFGTDGGVQLIQPFSDSAEGSCIGAHPLFERARWEWEGERVMIRDILGLEDVALEVRHGLLEVPLHETEPGLVFRFPGEYPRGQWMERVSGDFDCGDGP